MFSITQYFVKVNSLILFYFFRIISNTNNNDDDDDDDDDHDGDKDDDDDDDGDDDDENMNNDVNIMIRCDDNFQALSAFTFYIICSYIAQHIQC